MLDTAHLLTPLNWRLTWVTLLGVTLLSGALRLAAWNISHRIESDTNPFLMVVARLHGDTTPQEQHVNGTVLYRFTHPMYALMIRGLEPLTPNWIVAARLAALIPGLLIPAVLCLIAWQLDTRFWSGAAAGILGAVSWSLIVRSNVPMPDMAFVLFSALMLWMTLAAINRVSWQRIAAAGLFAGLAWATRPNGAIYLLVAGAPVAFTLWRMSAANTSVDGYLAMSKKHAVVLLSVFAIVFTASGKCVTLALKKFHPEGGTYSASATTAIQDSILFSKGGDVRDQEVYRLNSDCTDLNMPIGRKPSGWIAFIGLHGADIVWATMKNFRRLFAEVIPRILEPFGLIFLPLAIGCVFIWRRCSSGKLFAVGIYAIPFLLIIPILQLHNHYLLPLLALALPLAGIGINEMWTFHDTRTPVTRTIVHAMSLIFLVAVVFLTLHDTFHAYRRADKYVTYRHSAQWIQERHGEKFPFAVMSRYHGMYAYLKCTKTSLPVDTLDRVARYCRHTNTRYIVVGPDELQHNEHFRSALAKGDVIETPDATFKVVATFNAPWNEPVRLVEVAFPLPSEDGK